jgi:hypothetical protein
MVRARKIQPSIPPHDDSCPFSIIDTVFEDIMKGAGVVFDAYDWRLMMCVNKTFHHWLPSHWKNKSLPTYAEALLVLGSERALKDIENKKALNSTAVAKCFIARPRSPRDVACWQKILGGCCFHMENSVEFESFALWNLRPETESAFHHLYNLGVLPTLNHWLSSDYPSNVPGLRSLITRGSDTFIAFIRRHIVPHAPKYQLAQNCIVIYDSLINFGEKQFAKKALTVFPDTMPTFYTRFHRAFRNNTLDPEFVEMFFDAGGSRWICNSIIRASLREHNPITALILHLFLKHDTDGIKDYITNAFRYYLYDKDRGLLCGDNREFEMIFSDHALALLAEFKIDIPSLCTEGPRVIGYVQ